VDTLKARESQSGAIPRNDEHRDIQQSLKSLKSQKVKKKLDKKTGIFFFEILKGTIYVKTGFTDRYQ
jgi:hypothetical protein